MADTLIIEVSNLPLQLNVLLLFRFFPNQVSHTQLSMTTSKAFSKWVWWRGQPATCKLIQSKMQIPSHFERERLALSQLRMMTFLIEKQILSLRFVFIIFYLLNLNSNMNWIQQKIQYRRPLLFAVLVLAVRTIRGLKNRR